MQGSGFFEKNVRDMELLVLWSVSETTEATEKGFMLTLLRHFRTSFILFLIGTGCLLAFNLSTPHVAANGSLNEPFAFIPLAWLFLGLSAVTFVVNMVRTMLGIKRQHLDC
ncbi:DUF3955 domain-containing protein [Salinivibrio sp. VYel9]|nr:DUF3955 domain-containing protein [Salinivibrio sp. VYel7]MPX92792.1 DUF3955 domain-containing protein [Salinivibrio sp. VYel9]MPX95524.1 DUF3955 domain-containing protein [Salinivibrio sp. VYel6]MPX99010.1 DUF3955 domain-containing protein [Salinivibrio sp. VYel4]MPY02284.1 DUF3955 domain-containing protein [Salinivibrio sp. VYel5]MPY04977.1 DUF3955 domain-containing protein [Salinivibrio sp. VYel8]MPY12803.1 DUF3955 domain-containing protein [Salinivibrio sp. VGrn1]